MKYKTAQRLRKITWTLCCFLLSETPEGNFVQFSSYYPLRQPVRAATSPIGGGKALPLGERARHSTVTERVCFLNEVTMTSEGYPCDLLRV